MRPPEGHVDEEERAAARPADTSRPEYRSPLVSARLLRIVAVGTAAVGAALAAYLRSASGVLDRIQRDPLSVYQDDFLQITVNGDRVALALLASQAIMTILLVVWSHRMYRNLRSLGAATTRFTTGWAIGAWFVPFLNFVRPKQIVDETWRSSDPELPDPFATPPSPWVPKVVHFWWAFWILATLSSIGLRVGRYDPTISDISDIIDIEFAGAVSIAVSALFLERTVARLTMRQHERAVRLGRAEPLAEPWVVTVRAEGEVKPSAAAVVVLPWLVVAGAFALGSWTIGTTLVGDTGLTSTGGRSVQMEDLGVGECFDLPAGTYVVLVPVVACDDPHDAEFLAQVTLGALDDPYPGEAAIVDLIAADCVPAFDEFVGIAFEESIYDIRFTYPLDLNWAAGSRSAECFVVALDGSKLEGSVRDAGR